MVRFPDNDDFNAVLRSLRVIKSEKFDRVIEIPATVHRANKHSNFDASGLTIPMFALDSGAITLETVITKLEQILTKEVHPSNRTVALYVLALYCLSVQGQTIDASPVQTLNELMDSISDAEVEAYLVSAVPARDPNYMFAFGNFVTGPVPRKRLKRACSRSGSDYYKLYKDELKDKLAAWTSLRSRCIFWYLEIETLRQARSPLTDHFVCSYFEALSELLMKEFSLQYREQQSLYLTLGAPDMHLDSWGQALKICVYFPEADRDSTGWVCPYEFTPYQVFDYCEADKRYSALHGRLLSDYDFQGLNDCPLHQSLYNFVRFTSKGRRHELAGHSNEALLHFVIALELIFGEAKNTTASVCSRAAVVTYLSEGRDYGAQKKHLERLYNFRSKFVHEGKPVPPDAIGEVRAVCLEIVHCLLRLAKYVTDDPGYGIEKWHKQLGILIAKLDGEVSPSEEELESSGILPGTSKDFGVVYS